MPEILAELSDRLCSFAIFIAERTPAYAESAEQLRLVANSYLAQLYARAENGCEVLDKLAEIDASLS